MSRRAKNKTKTGKNAKPEGRVSRRRKHAIGADGLPANYWKASELARDGQYDQARAAYAVLERAATKGDSRLRILIRNDFAVLAAMHGKYDEACQSWRAAIESTNECLPARLNLGLVEAELSWAVPVANSGGWVGARKVHRQECRRYWKAGRRIGREDDTGVGPTGAVRVAVLSFLFNWPSTGGGNMHTAGLVDFLGRDGYEVRHFVARYPGWGIGRVEGDGYLRGEYSETCGRADGGVGTGGVETLGREDGGVGDPRRTGVGAGRGENVGRDGVETLGREDGGVGDPCRTGETFGRADGGVGDPRRTGVGAGRQECRPHGLVGSEGIEFDEGEWNVAAIRERFRAAVDSFAPDYVVISDAWNMKPHLAEAMRGYPYYLLLQAQECLCPLNNLRLLGIGPTQVEQCPRNQLATPQVCHQCLVERGHHAGALHQHERSLAGVGTAEYDRLLRQSFYDAEAVLVLNPITAALVEPYARRVCIVPWGIDAARFPWAVDETDSNLRGEDSSPPRTESDVVPSGLGEGRKDARRRFDSRGLHLTRGLHPELYDLAPLGLWRLRMWSVGLAMCAMAMGRRTNQRGS